MFYKIEKVSATGKVSNYSTGSKEELELIIKGWNFNGLFYEKKNVKSIIIITEMER